MPRPKEFPLQSEIPFLRPSPQRAGGQSLIPLTSPGGRGWPGDTLCWDNAGCAGYLRRDLWHGASPSGLSLRVEDSPWSRYSGTSGCIQPDQQERSDLLFHARKIAALLLIRPAYGTTPRRTAGHLLAAHATLAAAGIARHPNAGRRLRAAQQKREELPGELFVRPGRGSRNLTHVSACDK
jgi:hypothetical protein